MSDNLLCNIRHLTARIRLGNQLAAEFEQDEFYTEAQRMRAQVQHDEEELGDIKCLISNLRKESGSTQGNPPLALAI